MEKAKKIIVFADKPFEEINEQNGRHFYKEYTYDEEDSSSIEKEMFSYDKCINSDFKITNIDTLKSIISFLIQDNDYLYRGYRKDCELECGLSRNGVMPKEIDIIQLFNRYADVYITSRNFLTFIANAQHYGLYTRLIDLTNNIFVALYFACTFTIDKDEPKVLLVNISNTELYKVYNVFNFQDIFMEGETLYFNTNNTRDDFPSQYKKFLSKVRESDDTITIIEPPYSNNRMMVQRGKFMVQSIDNPDNWKKLLLKNTITLTIDPKIRYEVVKYIKDMGYDSYHMMPDINGLCEAINNEYK